MKKIATICFVTTVVAIILVYYSFRSFTVSDVQSYEWVPDNCSSSAPLNDYCGGIQSFDSESCMIKDDGYIYSYCQAVAKFINGGHPPFLGFGESSPRTGGNLQLMDLATGKECSYDTTN